MATSRPPHPSLVQWFEETSSRVRASIKNGVSVETLRVRLLDVLVCLFALEGTRGADGVAKAERALDPELATVRTMPATRIARLLDCTRGSYFRYLGVIPRDELCVCCESPPPPPKPREDWNCNCSAVKRHWSSVKDSAL